MQFPDLNDIYDQLTQEILIDALRGRDDGSNGWGGAAGVREPRRPRPFGDAGAIVLPRPHRKASSDR